MAIIYTYPIKSTPVNADKILISDSADNNKTKQITVESIRGLTAGVTQIIAGTNVTIDPVGGTGNVTINASGGGTPGGSDTQMQYNNGGSFGGTTGLTWDDSTNILSIGTRFEGDIDGAVLQQVLVKEPGGVSKGDVVYISGGSGNNPEVRKAQANSISTMAALGIMKANTAEDVVGECVTTGEITGLNLTGFTTGDELFVSNAVAGGLLTSAPAGEANLVQKIGKVIKGGAGGALTVLGAFRTNATPNLNQGSLFIGDASNQTSTLAIGATSGHVLTSNGTTASWAAVPASLTSLTLAGDFGTPQIINDVNNTITIAGLTGIDTAAAATGTINITNADRGSSQNIFKTIAVSGQPNVIANVNNDTLNLTAGTGITLTTNAAGQSVRIEATAATIPTTGWNPINIPSGTGYNFTTGDSVMLQVVAEATFVCSKMKFFAEYGTGSGGPNMRFDIYEGQLKDPSTGLANGTWLGGGLGPGSPTADAGGIIEISVSGEAPVQITAGQNYVIYFRTSGGTYNILSAPSVALIDNGVAIGGPNGGSLTAPQIDLQSEITSKVFNATKPEARLRPCCHLYNI